MATMIQALLEVSKHREGVLAGDVALELWPESASGWNKPNHGGL